MTALYLNNVWWGMIFHRVFYQRTDKEIASQLFDPTKTVYLICQTFINTDDVKHYVLG